MTVENIINTRIQLRYDTWQNWSNTSVAGKGGRLILKKGEIGICAVPQQAPDITGNVLPPAIVFKVGDGVVGEDGTIIGTEFCNLPWVSALAADVHPWAKTKDKPTYDYSEITSAPDYRIQADEQEGHIFYLQSRKKGEEEWTTVSTITIPDNDTTSFIITAAAKGDEVITLTGTDGTNGVSYEAKHAEKGPKDGYESKSNEATINGSGASETIKIPHIEVDKYGHVTAAEDKDVTITMPTIPEALKSPAALTIQVNGTAKDSYDGSEAKVVNISVADLGISGAMSFLGLSSTPITDGGTQKPTIGGSVVDPKPGDVVLCDDKEFVWTTENKWEELGDESSHALKSIRIEGGAGLTGGGTLEDNRTIEHAVPTGASEGAKGSSESRTYIKTVTTDEFGHVTGVTTGTETVTDTNTAHGHTAGAGLSVSGNGGISGTTTYSLKSASTDEIGGIQVSKVNTETVTVNEGTSIAGRYYPVELNRDNKAIVNVPWANNDTNQQIKAFNSNDQKEVTFGNNDVVEMKAGIGLKISANATDKTITYDIDDSVIFVLNGGSATTVI